MCVCVFHLVNKYLVSRSLNDFPQLARPTFLVLVCIGYLSWLKLVHLGQEKNTHTKQQGKKQTGRPDSKHGRTGLRCRNPSNNLTILFSFRPYIPHLWPFIHIAMWQMAHRIISPPLHYYTYYKIKVINYAPNTLAHYAVGVCLLKLRLPNRLPNALLHYCLLAPAPALYSLRETPASIFVFLSLPLLI